MAQRVEDLKVWQRAREFSVAVNAIIGRPGFQRDRRLREQLEDAVDSVIANIAEGFTQPTDKAFARADWDCRFGLTTETEDCDPRLPTPD